MGTRPWEFWEVFLEEVGWEGEGLKAGEKWLVGGTGWRLQGAGRRERSRSRSRVVFWGQKAV